VRRPTRPGWRTIPLAGVIAPGYAVRPSLRAGPATSEEPGAVSDACQTYGENAESIAGRKQRQQRPGAARAANRTPPSPGRPASSGDELRVRSGLAARTPMDSITGSAGGWAGARRGNVSAPPTRCPSLVQGVGLAAPAHTILARATLRGKIICLNGPTGPGVGVSELLGGRGRTQYAGLALRDWPQVAQSTQPRPLLRSRVPRSGNEHRVHLDRVRSDARSDHGGSSRKATQQSLRSSPARLWRQGSTVGCVSGGRRGRRLWG
jgi:hypothetical protein